VKKINYVNEIQKRREKVEKTMNEIHSIKEQIKTAIKLHEEQIEYLKEVLRL